MTSRTRKALLVTHEHAEDVAAAAEAARTVAEGADWELFEGNGQEVEAELCVALGGDGTILRAMRDGVGRGYPVFGVNYGRVGFLAACEASGLEAGLTQAFAGDLEVLELPALEVSWEGGSSIGLNDVAFLRRPHSGVAELGYRISGEEVGRVRCDGLVAATPTGSTGYNLANNGPILAWGVEGYAVTYIAPHTLTARALIVAPGDVLNVVNHRSRDSVDVVVDGIEVGELEPGSGADVSFREGVGRLAQLPGSNFYHRIAEKFGHLAS